MSRQPSLLVTLVGKSSLLKEGVGKILRAANFRILASSSSAQAGPSRKSPDRQLLLFVQTGSDFEGMVEQVGSFRSRHPGARRAIVADSYRPDQLISVFRAGANGYFVDVMTSDAFLKSIDLV